MAKGLKGMLEASNKELQKTKNYQNDTETVQISSIHPKNIQEQNTTPPKESSDNKGGRPKNIDKGIPIRKQYTLTLKEDTYKMIIDKARLEELSFAKYMERAALEYIERHK